MAERIAIFLPSFGMGGVARMMVNLAGGMMSAGHTVDLVVRADAGLPFLPPPNPGFRVIALASARPKEIEKRLCAYLAEACPRVLLSARMKNGHETAVLACRQAGGKTRVFLRIATHMTRRGRNQNLYKRWREKRSLARAVRQADGVIAVSGGVAADLAGIAGISPKNIHVLPNPVVSDDLYRLAAEPLRHPWFAAGEPPVILGAGGFRNQKDFLCLIEAFARVRKKVKARLVILGKGRLQAKMRQLADRLGVSSDMQLPGFVENPYPHMAAAAVFVLSSAWEGSPNVLVEAMALGTPVAATDCPSGPREILQDGAYGRLTAVGDAEGLAEAIRETLAEPPDRHRLTAGALRYTVQASSAAYLAAFGIRPEQPVRPCPARVFSGAQERGVQTA